MRFALTAALVLSACDTSAPIDGSCYAPDTGAMLEATIERWESVHGPVSGDFRDTLQFQIVEGGPDGWHPACPDPSDPDLKGCTTWDRDTWEFHVQILWCMSPELTERTVYHELGHALSRHHLGDIDPDHLRVEVWNLVIEPLQDGVR